MEESRIETNVISSNRNDYILRWGDIESRVKRIFDLKKGKKNINWIMVGDLIHKKNSLADEIIEIGKLIKSASDNVLELEQELDKIEKENGIK